MTSGPLTRRGFLAGAGAGVAGLALPGVALAGRRRHPSFLRRGSYRVGERFFVTGPDGTVRRVVLVRVSDLQGRGRRGRRLRGRENAFMLVFEQPTGGALEQGTYSFANGRLGRRDLFVVPGAGGARQRYVAVVNRA